MTTLHMSTPFMAVLLSLIYHFVHGSFVLFTKEKLNHQAEHVTTRKETSQKNELKKFHLKERKQRK